MLLWEKMALKQETCSHRRLFCISYLFSFFDFILIHFPIFFLFYCIFPSYLFIMRRLLIFLKNKVIPFFILLRGSPGRFWGSCLSTQVDGLYGKRLSSLFLLVREGVGPEISVGSSQIAGVCLVTFVVRAVHIIWRPT